MNYEVSGSVLNVKLEHGDKVFKESSRVVWIQGDVEITPSIRGRIDAHGAAPGETSLRTSFYCRSEKASIGFGLHAQCSLIEIELKDEQKIIGRKDLFVLADSTITVDQHANHKLDNDLYFWKLIGPGRVFWGLLGGKHMFSLTDEKELLVDAAYMAMYEESIEIEMVRTRGVKKRVGSNKEMRFTKLSGAGKVWLQGIPK